MTSLKEFSKDAIIYGLGNGLKKFIGLFLLPFYTRALTPSDYGIIETLSVFVFFVTALFDLGINASTGRYYYMAKTEYEKGRVLFTGLIMRLLIIIPTVVLSLFSKSISILFFGSDQYTWLIFVTCMIIPFNLLNQEQTNILRFIRAPWKYNVVTLLKMIMGLTFGISLVVFLKKGPLGAQLATLFTGILLFFFSFFYYNRKRYTYKFSPYWAKRMLNFGFPMIWASIATWVFQVSDRYFLLYYQNTTAIGLYSIGIRFAQILLLINMAVDLSYKPLIINQYEEEKDVYKFQTRKTARNIFHIYATVTVLIAILVSVLGTDLIKHIATKEYVYGAMALPFLLFGHLIYQSRVFTSIGIGLKEKTKHFVWLLSVTAGVNILLNFYFIPRYSFVGAAFTTLLSSLVYFTLASFVGKKLLDINLNFVKMMLFWFLGFAIAVAFPFIELQEGRYIPFYIKFIVIGVCSILPFMLGIIKISYVKKVLLNFIQER